MNRTHNWGQPLPRTARGYGTAHDRIRRRLLREEPYCRVCIKEGRGEVKATFADHIKPRCLGGSDAFTNYQPLCRSCSLTKTGREGAMIRNAKRRARKRDVGP